MRFLLGTAFLLCACTSVTLSPDAKKIRVVEHKQDLDERCVVTEKIAASDSQIGPAEFLLTHQDDARKKLLNMAAEKKGDTVYIYESSPSIFGSSYKAFVLRCSGPIQAKPTFQPSAPKPFAGPPPASISEPTFGEAQSVPLSQPLPEAAPPSE